MNWRPAVSRAAGRFSPGRKRAFGVSPIEVDTYFQRFGSLARQIPTPPHPALGMIVVIPCFNEPDLIASLETLWKCARPHCAVEVIVVVNSAANSPEEIRERNRRTCEAARVWAADRGCGGDSPENPVALHLLHFPDLPPKHAGVGLARKIGMDEAALRFDDLGREGEGIIVCFDADCLCEPNYFTAIEFHFERRPESPGCGIHFEHPLAGPLEPELYEAIAAYELHLRCYVQGLRLAGFPHAFHTIGSSMAVRSAVYKSQGGMNRRKAGEDFYFLHKIIPLGHFSQITETMVIPSPRPSDRVPFGTGRAVREFLLSGEPAFLTYPVAAFLDLQSLFCQASTLHAAGPGPLPESIRQFLEQEGFPAVLAELRANTRSEAAFVKRFFQWFNGFLAMKFIHFARDHFYGEEPVPIAAGKILQLLGSPAPEPGSLLAHFRALDRQPWPPDRQGPGTAR